MKKESFLEKNGAYFFAILSITMMFIALTFFYLEKIPFEDCLCICIFCGVGSIINMILVTGERIINKINELNKEK